jgi:hypothetical protein
MTIIDCLYFGGSQIDTGYAEAGFRELYRQREAHISEANDSDTGGSGGDPGGKRFGGGDWLGSKCLHKKDRTLRCGV